MIQRKKENWFRMLFIWHGSVLPQLLPRLLVLLSLSVVIVYLNGTFYHYKIPLNPAPFTIFGLALALFLGFRNNVSYDRYREARKLWGALLNDSRSLARQALTLTSYQPKSKEIAEFVQMLIVFTYLVLLHRTVYLYCFLLPFGLVDSLGWLTPLITVFIAYTFVAFEAIADELEEPFGTEPNDLALNAISTMIEATLLEMIGKPVLEVIKPKGYIID